MPRRDPDNLSDRICIVPTCPKREQARGLCPKHYQRQRLYGTTFDPNSAWLRFWRRVEASDSDGCWLWVGQLNHAGYGVFQRGYGSTLAHRVAFEWMVGPIPEGLELDHLCRVHNCINPRHLEPVTRDENMRRARGWKHPNHRNVGKTHCPHGHPYDAENTYVNANGDRICRACNRRRSLENYHGRTANARP